MNEENGKSAELPAPPPDGRRYAGFWIRAVASIIDDCIVMAASLVLTVAGLYVIYQIT
jgi:hypothetical protein